jgi:hypothetical protein
MAEAQLANPVKSDFRPQLHAGFDRQALQFLLPRLRQRQEQQRGADRRAG